MRPHMSRIEPNRVEKKWVLLAFGECAACTERDENKLDVGHLYEDATSRRATRATLLVLCSGCNQAEDRSRWDSKPDRRRSKPDEVRNLAKRRYEQVLTHRHTLRTDLPPIYLKKTGFFQTQSSAFSKRSNRYGPSDGETSSQPPCRKSGDSAATATSAWCNAGRFSIDFPWFSMTIGSGSKRRQLIASGDDFFVRLRASQVTRSGLNSILRCLFDARL